eukprot:730863_1
MRESSELIKVHQNGQSYTNIEDIEYEPDDSVHKKLLDSNTYGKTGTILGSSINLSNSNIGIGTIGLAFGLVQSGWFLGGLLFVFCHFLNHITMYMMMEVASTMEISTYAIVCNKCGVPVLQIISDYSMIINKLLSVTA